MPSCPNCGRDTMRTEDWVCQWCGYPLLSKSYKKIDKTYKQLQAERSSTGGYIEPELEAGVPVETRPEPAPEPLPPNAPEHEAETQPEPAAEVKPEPVPGTPPAPEPEPTPVAEAKPESVIELPPSAPLPASETVVETKTEAPPQPAPQPSPPPVPAPAPVAEEKPEPIPESPPAPVSASPPAVPEKLEITKNGVVTTVAALNHFFQTDRAGTNTKLKDQTIRVTGEVEKVFVRDHLDIRYIVLTSEPKAGPWSVRCSFEKEAVPELNRLSTGQSVTVQGIYDGYGKNIIIKECSIIA
jgi:ribosomal protein L37E